MSALIMADYFTFSLITKHTKEILQHIILYEAELKNRLENVIHSWSQQTATGRSEAVLKALGTCGIYP